MPLSIHIKKVSHGPSILAIERPNGTKTFSRLAVDLEIHDMAHYVVEKQLDLKKSFFGLLSDGYEINDFQLPKEKRPKELWPQNIPKEALVTEHLVNLLTIDFMDSKGQMDILESLETILKENDLPFPNSLNSQKLKSIKKELAHLMEKWNVLEGGQELKMELEL